MPSEVGDLSKESKSFGIEIAKLSGVPNDIAGLETKMSSIPGDIAKIESKLASIESEVEKQSKFNVQIDDELGGIKKSLVDYDTAWRTETEKISKIAEAINKKADALGKVTFDGLAIQPNKVHLTLTYKQSKLSDNAIIFELPAASIFRSEADGRTFTVYSVEVNPSFKPTYMSVKFFETGTDNLSETVHPITMDKKSTLNIAVMLDKESIANLTKSEQFEIGATVFYRVD